MNWEEWIKVFIDKLKVRIVLISIFSSSTIILIFLLDKGCSNVLYCLFFGLVSLSSGSYLIVELISFIGRKIKTKQDEKKNRQFLNDKIWRMFLTLSSKDIENIYIIFDLDEDPHDKYTKILSEYSKYIYADFRVDGYQYIEIEAIGNSYLFRIDPYFYKLIIYYRKTGKKEKNIPFFLERDNFGSHAFFIHSFHVNR